MIYVKVTEEDIKNSGNIFTCKDNPISIAMERELGFSKVTVMGARIFCMNKEKKLVAFEITKAMKNYLKDFYLNDKKYTKRFMLVEVLKEGE